MTREVPKATLKAPEIWVFLFELAQLIDLLRIFCLLVSLEVLHRFLTLLGKLRVSIPKIKTFTSNQTLACRTCHRSPK